ncbi:hypothetical protein ONZ43_g1579 [Nemania bipapillata]|uniref:Uncharacterized protein n=1 Tax=Nemania bipapillata TaxID=110536 RepID=A0ACC2J486_9PEZI|nr:hypothetical protein ONZ43_g1579 [Nemania bipapillata]
MSHEHIISNAFVLFVAGYETGANIIHFTLLQLANNPAVQRQVQQDVDRIFGGEDPKTWKFNDKINPMAGSTLATAMNETLRLMPPVIEIPKIVSPSEDQTIILKGTRYTIPRNSRVGLVVAGAHRHPDYWPTQPSEISDLPTDLDDWLPGRWTRTTANTPEPMVAGAETDNSDELQGPETSQSLYRPVRGSFIPFSSGARQCLGRRFAQVEILVALAVIFQKYSLENAVDDWADDDEVDRMGYDERALLYAKAIKRSRDTMDRAYNVITLSFHGSTHVPVRLVPRGEERFVSWMD